MGYIKLQKGGDDELGISDYDLVCADNIGDIKLNTGQGSIEIKYLSQVQVEIKSGNSDCTKETLRAVKDAINIMNGASGPAPYVLVPLSNAGAFGISSTTMTVLPVPAVAS
jgi:hypothetical protein